MKSPEHQMSKQALRKVFLFLGQYPLDKIDSAPKVRTYSLLKAFQDLTDTYFITGTRSARRSLLWKYLLNGKLKQTYAIYLEAATSTSTETDLLFLCVARLLGIPIGIFIRDAHPLFGLVDTRSLKNKLLVLGWHISIWFYLRLAKVIFYPTESFAQIFYRKNQSYQVLPPAGRVLKFVPFNPDSRLILYVGGLKGFYGGFIHVLEAVSELSLKYPEIRLLCVCREDEKNELSAWLEQPWLEILHLDFEQILNYQDQIYLTVISLFKTPYADIALPLKLFDYMSLGRPVLSSDCDETARFFSKNEIGRIVPHSKDGFVDNINYLFENKEKAEKMGKNAYNLVRLHHNWHQRAQTVLNSLTSSFAEEHSI